jgi:hypothetical protein
VKFYDFWPKNDDKNGLEKKIIERRIFTKIAKFTNENDIFFRMEGFQKNGCGGCTNDK